MDRRREAYVTPSRASCHSQGFLSLAQPLVVLLGFCVLTITVNVVLSRRDQHT